MQPPASTSANRIHPLMAVAAISLTLVSLVGAAAIAGLLPTSHGAENTVPVPTMAVASSAPQTPLVQPAPTPVTPAPVVKEVVRYKTVVHHEYPQHVQQTNYSAGNQPVPVQPAPVAQNSALGIGIGAIVGGLAGNQVGGGKGRTLATIAGAVGGGYVGNEIAKRNQADGQ